MAVFRKYSSGLFKLLCVCMLMFSSVILKCNVDNISLLLCASAKYFLLFGFITLRNFLWHLITCATTGDNRFNQTIEIRGGWKC